jgi:hypothetical protein
MSGPLSAKELRSQFIDSEEQILRPLTAGEQKRIGELSAQLSPVGAETRTAHQLSEPGTAILGADALLLVGVEPSGDI